MEDQKIQELSPEEMEQVSGGYSRLSTKTNRTCPKCHVTGSHTRYPDRKLVCDNCGYTSFDY